MFLASYWTAMFDRFHLPLAFAAIGWRNLQIVRQRQREIINGKELHPLLTRHYPESIHFYLLVSLKTVTNSKDYYERRIRISVPLYTVQPAFGTIFRIKGCFRNNFKESQDAYLKAGTTS
jgi:hypothetical protein